MIDRLSIWRIAVRSICLAVLVLLAPVVGKAAHADVLSDIETLNDDYARANALVAFELKLCKDKGLFSPDTYMCAVEALEGIYRKVPNPLVGVDLLLEHYQRAEKLSELVYMSRQMTEEQGRAQEKASYKIYEDELDRRIKAAKEYVAALQKQQQDEQQAAAAAAEKERKRQFNNALGELGRQMLQPKVYAQPQNETEQKGCHRRGERTQGFNKLCFYDCMKGPYVLNIGATDLCPLHP